MHALAVQREDTDLWPELAYSHEICLDRPPGFCGQLLPVHGGGCVIFVGGHGPKRSQPKPRPSASRNGLRSDGSKGDGHSMRTASSRGGGGAACTRRGRVDIWGAADRAGGPGSEAGRHCHGGERLAGPGECQHGERQIAPHRGRPACPCAQNSQPQPLATPKAPQASGGRAMRVGRAAATGASSRPHRLHSKSTAATPPQAPLPLPPRSPPNSPFPHAITTRVDRRPQGLVQT